MKLISKLILFAMLGVLSAPALTAAPLGTAFTYQGKLADGGQPANGLYDFQFALHDAVTGGNFLANTDLDEVAVTNGLFTVQLDFGAAAFTGAARWLGITVGASTNGVPVTLVPRQPLTPAPYALFAATASSAVNATHADSVNFGGTGTNTTAARSDHAHFGQVWSGASTDEGLRVQNLSPNGNALTGRQGAGTGVAGPVGVVAGVWGDSSDGSGVIGESVNSRGVFGRVTGTGALNYGVFGHTPSSQGYGVFGQATAGAGVNYGVGGVSSSTGGRGVFGHAVATSGSAYGVYGSTDSPAGAGVVAVGSGTSGTALRIGSGGIRIVGAGLNTPTPAFIHHVTSQNKTTNGFTWHGVNLFNSATIIDNAFANGDPGAILIVTSRSDTAPAQFSVLYRDDLARWTIQGPLWSNGIEPGPDESLSSGSGFNVLVLKH